MEAFERKERKDQRKKHEKDLKGRSEIYVVVVMKCVEGRTSQVK